MKNYKRRNYLINKPLQLKYVVLALLLIGAYSVFIGYTVSIALESSQKVLENTRDVTPDALNNIEHQNRNTFVTMVVLLVVNAFVVGFLWLRAMHRIAGPIYRLEKNIKEFKSGHMPPPIRLRKGDEFKVLIDEFNMLLEYVQTAAQQDVENLDRITRSVAVLDDTIRNNENSDASVKEQSNAVLTELRALHDKKVATLKEKQQTAP